MTTELPFREIPDYPAAFTSGNVVARMVEGLGFRYYWATEGLRPQDLAFRPGNGARSLEETLGHIALLTERILNALTHQPNAAGEAPSVPFVTMRRQTLHKLWQASLILRQSREEDFEEYVVIFGNEEQEIRYPFWHILNGQLADALWHTGQVASFRRSSGNPFNSSVSVFKGRLQGE